MKSTAQEFWRKLLDQNKSADIDIGSIVPKDLFFSSEDTDELILEYTLVNPAFIYNSWISFDLNASIKESFAKIKEQAAVFIVYGDGPPLSAEEFNNLPTEPNNADTSTDLSFWLRCKTVMIKLWSCFRKDFKDGLEQNYRNQIDRKD